MNSGEIICPACGRANPATARTCRNCATTLAVPAPGDTPGAEDERRRAEQEVISSSELGTVQGGAWQGVSTVRKPGDLPLPPQVQAEALRREREDAQARAAQARVTQEREEQEKRRATAEARQRAEGEARQRSEAEARLRVEAEARQRLAGRICRNCGTPAPPSVEGGVGAFSFCLQCGASFSDVRPPVTVQPLSAVPPVVTVTSPVGVLRQQARREVRQPPVYAVAQAGGQRVAEHPDILPVTEATPFVAAILSFLLPGSGQLRNAQWSKGLALLLLTFGLLALIPIGIWSITALILRLLIALDAFRIAERRRKGQTIAPWQWDASIIAER